MMLAGLGLGVAFNTWPVLDEATFADESGFGISGLDIISYAIGLLVGMMLWQISSVRWAAMPYRVHKYFVSQMPVYRFVVLASACVLVLVYF